MTGSTVAPPLSARSQVRPRVAGGIGGVGGGGCEPARDGFVASRPTGRGGRCGLGAVGGIEHGQPRGQHVEAFAAVPAGFGHAGVDRVDDARRAAGRRRRGRASSASPVAWRCSPPSTAQIRAWSRESNSSTPPSCSMTAGPLSPMRACGVTISRVHRPAAMLIPPNDPTVPATTPITGASGRRSSTAEQISATALSPRLASCSRTPPVSNRMTAAVGVPARESAAASSSAWEILAPDTSPVPPPWKPCSMAAIDDGMAVDGAAGDDGAVVGLRGDALRLQPRRFEPVEGTGQHPQRAGIQQRGGAAERVEFDEAAPREQLLPGLARPADRCRS